MLTSPIQPTILIVEDDEVLGQVLARVLTCEGQTAVHVRSAGEALQRVRASRLRLVLIDAGLRDGTGLKLAEAIRAAGVSLPVILLTTHRLEKSALPSQGERLVSKSIDLPELRRTVNAALLQFPAADANLQLGCVEGPCRSSVDPPLAQSPAASL
jgi:two-component system response regulator MprA